MRCFVFSSVPRIPFAQRAPRTHVLDVHMCVTQNSLRHLKQCGWRILLDPFAKGMFSRKQTSAKTADASNSQATLSRACLGNLQTPRDQALLRLRSVATATAQECQRCGRFSNLRCACDGASGLQYCLLTSGMRCRVCQERNLERHRRGHAYAT